MAQFTLAGFDEAEKQLLMRGEKAVKAIPKMLDAGGEVLVRAQKNEVQKLNRSGRSTGKLYQSIKADRIVNGVDGGIYKEVYPQGTHHTTGKSRYRHRSARPRKVSNAEVGFVIEYGRSNAPAEPWMSTANEKSEREVNETMFKIWEEESK